MISFDKNICSDFEIASAREWLETNGIGGFASSTVAGANTRRYHALLTAATRPPLGRVTMLSKFEETLIIDGKSFALSANQYPKAVYPDGFKYLVNFRLDPFPVWTFDVEGVIVEKKIFMIHGSNATVVEFKVQSSKFKIELELKPLLAFCDYHHLQHETPDFNPAFETSESCVKVHPFNEMPALFFAHNAVSVEKTGQWYRNFEYAIERERGFDFREDLFQPFALKFDLKEAATVIASLEKQNFKDAPKFEKAERKRREKLIETAGAADDFRRRLVLAADQFIVSRGDGKTIIAGYPWFSDWGRDTMIALNGLTLVTNRSDVARSILLEFSKYVSEGMLPNRFPDAGDEPEYNNVDATLWYFEAIRAYTEKTGDYEFVRKNLYQKLINIVLWHLLGTRFQIKVDEEDGLLYAGEADVQLTWMDAKIGDLVVTPRTGKAVEIQALWYNALCIMANFSGRFGDAKDQQKYLEIAEKAKRGFNEKFWNEAENCLLDVINGDERDAAVRPNQIFAVSLPNPILTDAEKARHVVERVAAELLAPVGLRSLSPRDSRYCPVYMGTPFKRDSAYHQGTIWAWLIGGFVDALRKTNGANEATETRVREILAGLKNHLNDSGVGQIAEIFDADAPHKPRGCPAQAWSVAELLRVSY